MCWNSGDPLFDEMIEIPIWADWIALSSMMRARLALSFFVSADDAFKLEEKKSEIEMPTSAIAKNSFICGVGRILLSILIICRKAPVVLTSLKTNTFREHLLESFKFLLFGYEEDFPV